MPLRPGRPCAQTGCPRLITGSRSHCPEHEPPSWSRAVRPRVRGGSGWAWQRLRTHILERDGYTCVYCGARAEVVDHVIGVSAGGSDEESNLVAACRHCNERRRIQQAVAGRKKGPL